MFEGQASSSTQQPIRQEMQTTNTTITDSNAVNIQGSNNTINIHGQSIPSKIPDLSFELPGLPDYGIIGRDGDVSKIMSIFKEGNKRVAICGMGGMGKTTLAIYCAHKWMGKGTDSPPPAKKVKSDEQNQFFKNIVYFSVENQKNLEAAVKRLATKLKLEQRIIESQSVEELLKDILNLYQNENLLVILDNLVQVEDVFTLLDLSKQYEHLYILGTSQNIEIDVHFKIYNLHKISKAESLNLFLNVTELKIEGNEQTKSDFHSTFHELYELVDGLPISVSHAAAWIKQNMKTRNRTKSMEPTTENYTSLLKKYIKDFNDELKKEFPPQFNTPTSKSAYAALKLNIDKLLSGESKRLLTFLSYMDPADITVDIFDDLFDDLESALGEITQYSLIYIKMGRAILIHRLVQEVARTYLASESGAHMGSFILMLLCNWRASGHLEFMFEYLDGTNKIPEWLNLSLKEDLKAAVDRRFELEEDNRTLDQLRDAGYDVRDGANWPLPHKLMAIITGDYDDDAAPFFLIFDCIFNKFNAECLSGAEDGLSLHHVVVANLYLGIDKIHDYLSQKGVDINKRTTGKQLSPMHLVTRKYDIQQIPGGKHDISLLVSAGADVNAQDVDGNTPLHAAARREDSNVLDALLDQPGVQLNAKNVKNQTPLMIAVENSCLWVAGALIEAGARCDFRLENGDTMLHWAAKNDHDYLIEEILDCIKQNGQISVDEVNRDGQTALQLAVSLCHFKIASSLLEAGARYDFKLENGDTVLHWAARYDYNIFIKFILARKQDGQISVDEVNQDGQTALQLAVSLRHFNIVRSLLEAGARYDFILENGDTVLHWAAKHHYYSLIEFMLARIKQDRQIGVDDINLDGDTPAHSVVCRKFDDEGHFIARNDIIRTLQRLVAADANLNIRNDRGQTPLDLAQDMELDEKVIDFLKIYYEIISSARFDFRFENGDTVLHWAARYNYDRLINFILNRIKQDGQISIDEVNQDGQTALQLAVSLRRFQIARSLLEADARYDFRLENDDTILHRAAKYHKKKLIKCILDRIRKDGQIGVNDINLDGDTPAHSAVSKKYWYCYGIIRTLQRLVAAGADLNIRNNRGQTPLDLAQAMKLHEKVIEFLIEPSDHISESNSDSTSDGESNSDSTSDGESKPDPTSDGKSNCEWLINPDLLSILTHLWPTLR